MSRLNILNVNNETISVEVIRYFSVDSNNYLIYSLNEVDEQQYVKLYITKVVNNNGLLMGETVADENEWDSVKEAIKIIIKSNNEGNPVNNDLNYGPLNGITIVDSRIFKLSSALTDILKKDKPVFEQMDNVVAPEPVSQDFGMDSTTVEPAAQDFGVDNTTVEPDTQDFGAENISVEPTFESVNSEVNINDNVMPNIIRESLEPEVYGPAIQQEEEQPSINEDPLSVYQINNQTAETTESYNTNDRYSELESENAMLKSEINNLREKLNAIQNIINNN